MRAFALALLVLAPAAAAGFSFHYNENGGFGLYRPEGWGARDEGRSSRLTGPRQDFAQTEIFAGSDWVGRVHDGPGLLAYVREQSGGAPVEPIEVSGLAGYAFRKGADQGYWYLLRGDQNVIVLEYTLRGSSAQRREAAEVLGSFEIRTGGISYP